MVQYGRLEEQPPAWVMILVKVKILWEETKRNRKFKGQDIWNITLSTPRWTTSSSPSTLRPTLSSTPTRRATLSTSLSTLNLCLSFPPVPVCEYLLIIVFSGLQIPNCDRVSFPAKEKLHLVQDLGQKFLRQLSLPHQVYANTHI